MGKVRIDGGNAPVLWCIDGGRPITMNDSVGGTGGSAGHRVMAMSSFLKSGVVALDQLVCSRPVTGVMHNQLAGAGLSSAAVRDAAGVVEFLACDSGITGW